MAGYGDAVCASCIGDEVLRQRVTDTDTPGECSFCGAEEVPTVSIEDLADWIDPVLREWYRPGEEMPHASPESDNPYYEQEGESADYIIQEVAHVEPEVAEALMAVLSGSEERAVRDGDTPYYDGVTNLVHVDLGGSELMFSWQRFEERLQRESRFFAESDLKEIGAALSDIAGAADAAVVVGPEHDIRSLHRARVASDLETARQYLRSPARELGPPPPAKARAGRMNAAGISFFYGALTEKVAVAEVRPPIGSFVVVAEFAVIRDLRLLDLTYFTRALNRTSMFSPKYATTLDRLYFADELHHRICQPVQPHDEVLGYLATQAFAEYVAQVLSFDGMLYRSVQVGAWDIDNHYERYPVDLDPATTNVVLFRQASLVEGGIEEPPDAITGEAAHGRQAALSTRAAPKVVRIESIELRYRDQTFELGDIPETADAPF